MDNNSKKIVILGAGLAGLSTAYHLKKDYEIYEKEKEIGGLCRSKNIDGFTFDYDGHLLHFRNRYTLDLLKRLMNGNLVKHRRNSWIYSLGTYTRYPFQANFFGLPAQINKKCILGLIKAKYINGSGRFNNGASFEKWILHTFGRGIARYFMFPYNTKFWTVPPRELTCEWLDGYIPIPTMEEVFDGALTDSCKPFGYNWQFWYPSRGGIREVALAFQRRVKKVHTLKEAVRIDTKKKEVEFRTGEVVRFGKLISSLPLVEMEKLINKVPENIRAAFGKLRYTSVFNLNLGIDKEKISDKHWVYFPESNFVFYRVGFPMNFSSSLTPKKKSSIYVEVSYSKDKPIDKDNMAKLMVEDLIKADLITEKDKIVIQDIVDIKYGYIIYDKNYRNAVETIENFLTKNGIFSIGRYGKWKYMSMEDAILDGKIVANKLLDKR